uniref:Dynein axonemal assembly factor 4 n=1 Tax=Sphaeramia orbicularis TaxID=375764 RepID=A0A672ZJP0_9TELE
MPVLVPDYTWTQTQSTVHIHLPLKGAKPGRVHVTSTDEYLKVHFQPFLLEVFLFQPVDDDRSTARIGNGVANITLYKKTNNQWEQLMINTSKTDKEVMKQIRMKALMKNQEKLTAESKTKTQKRQEERKYTLQSMMKLEDEERDSIRKIKDTERKKTTAELEEWQTKQKGEEDARVQRKEKERSHGGKNKPGNGSNPLTERPSSVYSISVSEVKKPEQKHLPAPRAAGNIQVKFTPRVFPTALRESRVAEEEEWLRKQAEARRSVNAEVEELKDLKDEERNPDWLKEKGDRCFLTGDYLGAVNAYNLAIRLNRKIPALYSNRAACHLKLKNLHKAIEDCSQALSLLTPPVQSNAASRVRVHVRRGTAFCHLQLYTEGLLDYQAALNIDPENQALQADAQRIRNVIQGLEPETQQNTTKGCESPNH